MPADMRAVVPDQPISRRTAQKGFPGADGAFTGLMVVRQGDQVYVYENACPHIGTPLDWTPDRFLTADGRRLICATHGAEFTIATGDVYLRPVPR